MGWIPIVGLGWKEIRRGCPLTRAVLCLTASYGAIPRASERRSREGRAWMPGGPVCTWALSMQPPRLPQALTFSLVLSSDFAMAGEARPGPAQQGEKRHQGTAW